MLRGEISFSISANVKSFDNLQTRIYTCFLNLKYTNFSNVKITLQKKLIQFRTASFIPFLG